MIDRRSLLRSLALVAASGVAARAASPAAPTKRVVVDPAAFSDDIASGIPDGRSDNGIAIQRAINRVFDEGGGTVSLRAGHYRFARLLVIPSNVVLEGVSRDATRLERISDDNSRSIIIGTYGPVIGRSPRVETRFTIEDCEPAQTYIDLANPADAVGFAAGDMVAIDGAWREVPHGKGFWMPNTLNHVVSVEARRIHLATSVDGERIQGDYLTRDDRRPGIRKLNTGKPSGIKDSAGRAWPLFVAENAGIRRMTLAQSQSIGWFLPTLAVDNCVLEDLRIVGRGIGGNPVAHSRMERLEVRHEDYPIEFAYLSHDTLVKDSTFIQVGDRENKRSHGIWVNSNEGGKRITFDNITRHGMANLSAPPDYAIDLENGSILKNSRIYAPSSKGAVAFRSSIIDSVIVSSLAAHHAVALADGHLSGSTIDGGSDVAVIADSNTEATGSRLRDLTVGGTPKRRSDFILKRKNANFTTVERCDTIFNRANPVLIDLQQPVAARLAAAGGGVATGLSASLGDVVLGVRNVWHVELGGTLTGSGRGTVVVRFNGIDQIALPFEGIAGQPFRFTAELTHIPGKADRLYTYHASLSHGSEIIARTDRASGVPASKIRKVDVMLVDVAPDDRFTRDLGRIRVETVGDRV